MNRKLQSSGLLCFYSLFMLYSCTSIPKFERVKSVPAFIDLRTGQTIHPTTVDKQLEKGALTIIGDGTEYKPKEVNFFSDGKNTFAIRGAKLFSKTTVPKNETITHKPAGTKPLDTKKTKQTKIEKDGLNVLAKKVVEGKINLYASNLNSKDKPTSYKPIYYYIQSERYKNLQHLSYEALTPMVAASPAATKILKQYKTENIATIGLGCIGAAVAAIGVGEIFTKNTSESEFNKSFFPRVPIGVKTSTAGVVVFLTSAIINEANKMKLFRALKAYNSK